MRTVTYVCDRCKKDVTGRAADSGFGVPLRNVSFHVEGVAHAKAEWCHDCLAETVGWKPWNPAVQHDKTLTIEDHLLHMIRQVMEEENS